MSIAAAASVEKAIYEHVEKVSRVAVDAFPRPRARAYRRAVALGYHAAGHITVNTHSGIMTSPLHLVIDANEFARRVDVASHEITRLEEA